MTSEHPEQGQMSSITWDIDGSILWDENEEIAKIRRQGAEPGSIAWRAQVGRDLQRARYTKLLDRLRSENAYTWQCEGLIGSSEMADLLEMGYGSPEGALQAIERGGFDPDNIESQLACEVIDKRLCGYTMARLAGLGKNDAICLVRTGSLQAVIDLLLSEIGTRAADLAKVAIKDGAKSLNTGTIMEAVLKDKGGELVARLQHPENPYVDNHVFALASSLGRNVRGWPNHNMLMEGIKLYLAYDGLIAHYRHGAADPDSLTGNGMLVYATEIDGHYRIVNESSVRYLADGYKGVKRAVTEFLAYPDLVNAIKFRGDKGWYANFIDPSLPSPMQLPRLRREGSFQIVNWEDEIMSNGTPDEIAHMREIKCNRKLR